MERYFEMHRRPTKQTLFDFLNRKEAADHLSYIWNLLFPSSAYHSEEKELTFDARRGRLAKAITYLSRLEKDMCCALADVEVQGLAIFSHNALALLSGDMVRLMEIKKKMKPDVRYILSYIADADEAGNIAFGHRHENVAPSSNLVDARYFLSAICKCTNCLCTTNSDQAHGDTR